MKLCKKCLKEVKDNAMICPYCGEAFTNKKEVVIEDTIHEENNFEKYTTEKRPYMDNGIIKGPFNKWISITLCILLGWLGAHKFYERKYITGIFYALTLGFWGIGIVLDLLKLIKQPKYYYVSKIPFIM